MASKRRGFFVQETRPEDVAARRDDLGALVAKRSSVPQHIGIERIRPNPFQARKDFNDLDELADAIRAQGFTSRLRVRPDPAQVGYFQLVYGERRLRAASLVGFSEVPCEVADHSDDDMIEIGLAENIQRRDLNPLEVAQAFQIFIEQRDYSIRRLAERIGKDKSYIEDRLALLRMPADVQSMVTQQPNSLRSAREISKLEVEARQPLIDGVVAGALTTAEVRSMVRDLTAPSDASDHPAPQRRGKMQQPLSPDPRQHTQKGIARDIKTMRAILSGWEQLIAQGEAERTLVAESLDTLTAEVKRIAELLRA